MNNSSKRPAANPRFTTRHSWLKALSILCIFGIPVGIASAQCPAVGADTTCGLIITVTKTGNSPCPAGGCAAITFTGQGPYDTIEDTLVGVVNAGNLPISSLVLTSSTDAFGFEGDGICGLSPITGLPYVPAPSGCPFGPTGYEGPGVGFTNINFAATSGTVSFSPPIKAGGTAYFSLEESLTQATACSTIINGSVAMPAGGGTSITAVFTPNQGYTLAQAAQLCGFSAWDWQQTVTTDPCADVYEAGSTTPLKAPPPYNDPPLKGYSYQHPPNAVLIPVYYNLFTAATDPLSLAANETTTTLEFYDAPADPCLSGKANGTGKRLGFTTHLVGIVGGPSASSTVLDTGIGFSYTDTFNGTSGGISVRNSSVPVDPGSGTGGITLTAYSATTDYQYPPSLAVSAINGVSTGTNSGTRLTLLGAGQATVEASGLTYSRVTHTFDGTVTLKNVSGSTLTGPFQVVLDSLSPGVTVANAAGSFGGWPYVSLLAIGSLAPGHSASASVSFADPIDTAISFAPVPYAGSFN